MPKPIPENTKLRSPGIDETELVRDAKPAGRLYFLGIGIDAYVHWQPLRNAVRDVEAIAALLKADYGLDNQHTWLLYNEEATRHGIIHQLEELADTVTDKDALIIYYAGHGHLNRRERGFWVPADAPRDRVTSLIRNSTIRDYIGDIPSLHTLLISDSCFSGSLFVRGQRSADLDAAELARLPSRWAISSGRQDEPVADGPTDGHSPFAQSVIDVLQKSARDTITTNFLYEQVREQTRANYQQQPDGGPLVGVGHKRGQFVFRRRLGAEAQKALEFEREIVTGFAFLEKEQPRKARRHYEILKKEVEEELSGGQRKTDLLNQITERIQFCRLYPIHRPLFEQLLQSPGGKEKHQWEEEIATLRRQLEDAQKLLREKEATLAEPEPMPSSKQQDDERMILIKGGSFDMGDVMGDEERDDETIHPVRLRDFYLASQPVTFAEYDAFCSATGSESPGDEGWGRADRPVINVSWWDAIHYCNWLSETEERQPFYTIRGEKVSTNPDTDGYRLPTEAEWEYAARQRGEQVRFGNGKNTAYPREINFHASEKLPYSQKGTFPGKTVPVGSLNIPNSLGLHEMTGNISEWCWDWYGDYPTKVEMDPRGPEQGSYRVLRGGSWNYAARHCRVAYRIYLVPTNRYFYVGFRLALSF